MKCQIIHPSLSDYLDDGLPAGEAREIKIHLDGCAACRHMVEDLGALRQAARELPLRSPHSELWNRVRAEVAREIDDLDWKPSPAPPPGRIRRLLDRRISFNLPQLAGVGVLVVGIAVSGVLYLGGATTPITPPSPDKAVAALLPEESALKQRIDQQISMINQRKASWDPEVRSGFEHHLARIDQSLDACRRMLAHNAQDRDHQQMYLALYQEKLRLLEDVNRLKW